MLEFCVTVPKKESILLIRESKLVYFAQIPLFSVYAYKTYSSYSSS